MKISAECRKRSIKEINSALDYHLTSGAELSYGCCGFGLEGFAEGEHYAEVFAGKAEVEADVRVVLDLEAQT